MKTIIYTTLALVAFAGNSVLCRLALGEDAIDATSFTSIRLLSGIVVLGMILKLNSLYSKQITNKASKGSWQASFMLFIYAATFSFAYLSLDTATGALILFGVVQVTMILTALLGGQKLHPIEWSGMILAISGFTYLMLPGASTPSILGFLLMSISGVAWAFYTLLGQGSSNPLQETAYNFFRTLPWILIMTGGVTLISVTREQPMLNITEEGVIYAILSGALASGLGYSLWYAALNNLSGIQAGVLQLTVPVIAALGGLLFTSEVISLSFITSTLLILGGTLLVILGKHYFKPN